MKEYRYIMFSTNQKGKDGCKYIQNVKYRIHEETPAAFKLAGKSGNVNELSKARLKGNYVTGDIARDKK